jgi:hypothetical protein
MNYLKRNSIEFSGYELSVFGQVELAKKSKDRKNALVGEYVQIIRFAHFRLIHPPKSWSTSQMDNNKVAHLLQ